MADRSRILFINVGHGLDHLFLLLYPTVVLTLEGVFGRSYGELLSLAVPGFIAFAAGTLPAGWLGDRWSRPAMLAIFFVGIGAASILTGFARTPFELAVGLTLIGLFRLDLSPGRHRHAGRGAGEGGQAARSQRGRRELRAGGGGHRRRVAERGDQLARGVHRAGRGLAGHRGLVHRGLPAVGATPGRRPLAPPWAGDGAAGRRARCCGWSW